MAPLAGKPPFATDEPDSFYESSPAPRRRLRQHPAPDPNNRTSAYNVYDNYLGDDKADNRQSGMGALGMGLLNMGDDDDDDDDDEDGRHKPQHPAATPPAQSKHAALAAATASSPQRKNSEPISSHSIAAPQPGYAAPIAALNLARPEPAAAPQGRQPPESNPQNLRIAPPSPRLQNPFDTPSSSPHAPQPPYRLPSSPSPSVISSEPHPLQPPITPITPVFARPAKSPGIKFADAIPHDPSKPIMRGNSEETLLPSRGEKGDDFWRRFSMVAKEENKKPWAQKESSWLKKTQSGSSRLSRWVWIVGVVLIVCIGGAIGIGWYLSHKSPGNQQPTAIGGSANEFASSVSSSTAKGTGDASGSSIFHVTPTHTVARRVVEASVTPVPGFHATHKRRIH